MLDFGHDEHEVASIVDEILAKLPGEAEMRAIDSQARGSSRRSSRSRVTVSKPGPQAIVSAARRWR